MSSTAPRVLLFQGDSITDAGRRDDPAGLGRGYVAEVAGRLAADPARGPFTVLNRGVSGDTVADVRARWDTDALGHSPDVVTLLVGINDTWRRFDGGVTTTTQRYEQDLRHLVTSAQDLGAAVVLVEPFLVPVEAEQWAWRPDLDPRIHAVRRIASELGTGLVCADGLLNQAAAEAGSASHVAADGVHPTELGHHLLARAWLDHAARMLAVLDRRESAS